MGSSRKTIWSKIQSKILGPCEPLSRKPCQSSLHHTVHFAHRFHGCVHQASMVRLEKNLMALMALPHWLIPSLASAKYQPLCAFTRIFVAKQCLKDSTFIYCCIIGEAINFEIGRCFFQRSWLGTRKDFCKMG